MDNFKDAGRFHLNADAIRQASADRWPEILRTFGLTEIQTDTRTRSTGTSCPLCGGHDRYSFKSAEDGSWACRHCGGGDGFSFLMRLNHWTFPETLQQVFDLVLHHIRPNPPVSNTPPKNKEPVTNQELHKKMLRQWENARPWTGTDSHPYAIRKQLSGTFLKQCRLLNDWLYVPLKNIDGQLISWQRFSPYPAIRNGESKYPRFFAKGVLTKGGMLAWGPMSFHILLTESISSADACYQLRHRSCGTACAFSASQLPHIAALLRGKYPESEIVLCGDNDQPGRQGVNQALETVPGCTYSYPPEGTTDWNDVLTDGVRS